MSWLYTYKAGPPGGSLTALLDFCESVRIRSEWAGGYRGQDPIVQNQHGEFSSPRKFHPAANFILETVLSYTDSAGDVTHPDGQAGHIYENFGDVKKLLLGGQGSLVELERITPDQGTVSIDVQLMGDALPTQTRHIFGWPLRAPKPFWTGIAASQQSPPTITNDGTAPAIDAIIDFTGTATDPRFTLDSPGDYVEIKATLPAGGVRVDVGAKTCVRITGGTDFSQNLRVNTPWWMEFDPGANAVTVTQASGTPTVTADFDLAYR